MHNSWICMIASGKIKDSSTWANAANVIALLIGCTVMVGWVLDIAVFKSLLPQFISMKFNTSVCFFVLAAANLIFSNYPKAVSSYFSILASGFVGTLCLLTLAQYQLNLDFGIDQLFFIDPPPLNPKLFFQPGRMAPITATLFVLISVARLLLFHVRINAAAFAQGSLIITTIIAFQALVSYFFGITYSFGIGYHTQMAFHTTVGLVMLSFATLMMKTSVGWMQILTADSAGGKLARNLLFWAISVPPFILWLNILGERAGLYDDNFSNVLRVTGNIIFFTTMVLKNASALHQSTLEQNKIQEEKLSLLAESQAAQKMRAIFDASFEGIIGMDENGLVTDCNHKAEKMFGWKKDDVLGKPLSELIVPPEHRSAHEAGRMRFMATGVPVVLNKTIEVEALRANGERFPIELSTTSIKVGEQFLFMGFIADITERKRTQSELIKARQEALNAAQTKSEFLANMSHEIRTPLNGIIGMTDLLLETPLDHTQSKYASIIQSSGTGLLTIINDILDFSKIDAGKLKLELIDFNPVTLLEEQAELMSAKASAKNLPLLSYVVGNIPAKVKGDPGRLGQILLNLISNAIKFTSEGRILVKVSMKSSAEGKGLFLFEIIDTGIGLGETQAKSLFAPFVQADASTARKYGGTGLGLSISKQLAELMHGKLWVESREGEGSNFCLEVPLELVDAPEENPAEFPEIQDLKAMVVDDDPIAREIIAHYLSNWGMEHIAFADPKSAWEYLESSTELPQVILIDSAMPVTSGKEFARMLSEHEKLKAIPRVLISAYERIGTTSVDHKLFKTSLGKPFKQSDLYNSIVSVTHENIKPVQKPSQNGAESSTLSEYRILVAEDNTVNQLLIKTQLQKLGYSAHVVADGNEVLESLRTGEYDLILMDCQMPEMDGYVATQKIREQEKLTGSRITIIALTANAMKEDEEYCYSIGMDDFISKPTKKDILSKTLAKWVTPKA